MAALGGLDIHLRVGAGKPRLYEAGYRTRGVSPGVDEVKVGKASPRGKEG
jgi:hypothetical protein